MDLSYLGAVEIRYRLEGMVLHASTQDAQKKCLFAE